MGLPQNASSMHRLLRSALLLASLGCPLAGSGSDALFREARPALLIESTDRGLPGTSVYALLLDRQQRLWAGTQEGLARRRGRGWETVPLPGPHPAPLVRALLEDRDGALWVGTEAEGLWRRKEGRWTQFTTGSGLPIPRVNGLLETQNGEGGTELWVATGGGGVARLHRERWTVFSGPEGIPDPWVWKVRELTGPDGVRALWAAGKGGLRRFRNGTWEAPDPANPALGAGANEIVSRQRADGGWELWASLWGQGLLRWDARGATLLGPAQGFPSRHPITLALARNARGEATLWAGTWDRGLVALEPGGFVPLSPPVRFPAAGIFTIQANPEGKPTLWAGTRGSGLVSLNLNGWRTVDVRYGLPSEEISAFAELPGPDGTEFWMGTQAGITRWGEGGRLPGPPLPFVMNDALSSGADGPRIWLATMQGLVRQNGPRWELLGPAEGLPREQATALAETRESGGPATLWVAFEGHGLYALSHGRWRHHGITEGLPHDWVYALLPLERELWVATRGGGVGRFRDGRWTRHNEGLPVLSVYGLTRTRSRDGRNWIWAATAGGGLARLDPAAPAPRWQAFPAEQLPGLPGDFLLRLEAHGDGDLFVSSPRGLARIRLQEGPDGPRPLRAEGYDREDGPPSQAATFGASHIDREGRVWFGTMRGAVVFDLGLELKAPDPGPPFLEAVSSSAGPKSLAAPIRFGPGESRLEFRFEWPVHHRREACRFRTQLLGLEGEPGPWQAEWRQTFTTLPAGSYRLRVWARDAQGTLGEPLDIPFTVSPSAWSSLPARLGYALLAAGLVWLILRIRLRMLRARTRTLRRLVAERTAELEAARQESEERSLTDPLTGLRNRRYADACVPEDLARIQRQNQRQEGPRACLLVFILDLDHFKAVNDRYGHATGDAVLKGSGARLLAAARSGDTVARWGGEEFLILARDASPEEAPRMAERFRRSLAELPLQVPGGMPIPLTVSVGFACFPMKAPDGSPLSWDEVLSLADGGLYEAKARGRNGWAGHLPSPAGLPEAHHGPGTQEQF